MKTREQKKAEKAKRLAAIQKRYAANIARWLADGSIPLPPRTEFRFHPRRRWLFDYAWPERRVAVEVQGGGGRMGHGNRKGIENDCTKTCTAQLMGWKVFPMTPRQFWGVFGESVIRTAFGTTKAVD